MTVLDDILSTEVGNYEFVLQRHCDDLLWLEGFTTDDVIRRVGLMTPRAVAVEASALGFVCNSGFWMKPKSAMVDWTLTKLKCWNYFVVRQLVA